MNVLYIGPNDSEWAQLNRPVSLAAAKWARGFLTALSKVVNVTALCHTYEIAWPKGNVLWRGYDRRLCPKEWACDYVSYPVLKYVREWWWKISYSEKAVKIISEKKIDVVLIYNCYEPWQVTVLRNIRSAYPWIKIIPIILDGDDPRKDNWRWMRLAAKYSNAFISLSWWVHCNVLKFTGRPSYHFDGGADKWCGTSVLVQSQPNQSFKLVHTGALDEWRGLDFMVEVVKDLTSRRKDVEFILCGKSSEAVLKTKFKDNLQVKLPGFVSESEMEWICNRADVLLNVRDPNHPDNILNYPSKLPHYLSFGRPVVSTVLQSLSPDYNDVIEFVEDDTVASYVKKVEEVLKWSLERRMMKYNSIKEWFENRKSWDIMVRDLVIWLKK